MRVRLCMLGLILAITAGTTARAEEIVLVVVNADLPVRHLSATDLRQVYLGDTTFWGGTKIHPAALQVPPEVFADFVSSVIGTTPAEFERYWMVRVFRKGGIPPRPFDRAADLLRFVARTPGAVGFVLPADLGKARDARVAARLDLAIPRARRPKAGGPAP